MTKYKRSANWIDQYIGSRIKKRRNALGMTQKELAQSIGITFQQVQKYEKAHSRVSASILYRIALTLKTHPNWFYFDMDNSLPCKNSLIHHTITSFVMMTEN